VPPPPPPTPSHVPGPVAPTPTPAPSAAPVASAPPPAFVPGPSASAGPAAGIEAAPTPEPRDDRPVYMKWWFWGAVGAVVVGAVVVGVVLGQGKDEPPLSGTAGKFMFP